VVTGVRGRWFIEVRGERDTKALSHEVTLAPHPPLHVFHELLLRTDH
jgi:hypothetical protein